MTPKLKPLSEQVVVVTGASSGIGHAVARRAAAAGARVLLVARGAAALGEAAAAIEAAGGIASPFVADVREAGQMRAAAEAATARYGRIDSWVHAAGVAIYAPLTATPEDEHRALFDTNYFGVVHGALAALPALKRDGGALIVVGSVVSTLPTPVLGAYAASKHAAKGWLDSLRIELAAAGAPVSVTLVKPSGIDTPIGAHAANHGVPGLSGEAKAPPPAYHPDTVADAVLHAAVHPRRELTVGGAGWAQAMLQAHAPALFDRVARMLPPLLFDPKQPPTPTDNLDCPRSDGAETATGTGRRTSLFTAATLHPAATLAGVGALAGAATALAWLRRRG